MNINSPIKSVQSIVFHAFPKGRAIKMQKCGMFDNYVVALGENGKLYTNAVRRANHGIVIGNTNWRWNKGLFKVLIQMKLITKEQRDEHFAAVEQHEKDRGRRFAVDQLKEACKDLGIEVPDYE